MTPQEAETLSRFVNENADLKNEIDRLKQDVDQLQWDRDKWHKLAEDRYEAMIKAKHGKKIGG